MRWVMQVARMAHNRNHAEFRRKTEVISRLVDPGIDDTTVLKLILRK
jgi:hypothetical protein